MLKEADWVAPDGMAVVWALRLLGHCHATRVYGPDFTLLMLDAACNERIPVGFYGASPTTLSKLVEVAQNRFPALNVAYAWSPPFRPLTSEEDEEVVGGINASGARILFVGLGTPKQEYWMVAHRGRVRAVMLGVGAAFDFIAGTKPQAPRWMMRIGMEWFFRLCTEPRRLWRRYLIQNPRFIYLLALQLLGWRNFSPEEAAHGPLFTGSLPTLRCRLGSAFRWLGRARGKRPPPAASPIAAMDRAGGQPKQAQPVGDLHR